MMLVNVLKDRCTVQRFTFGSADNYGRKAKAWADHLAKEPCLLMASSGRELNIGAEVVIADYKLLLREIDITEQDRVVIRRVTYEVLLVSTRSKRGTPTHKECALRVVR